MGPGICICVYGQQGLKSEQPCFDRPENRYRAPTQGPGKGRRPKNRHSSKAKSVSALVSCLLPVLACLCRVSPGSGSRVPRLCPFGFLFVLVPPHVFFYWPRASCSSSQREGRRVKRTGTDPRTGTGRRPKDRLLQVPLDGRCSETLVSCIRSIKSAGHMVVCVVTGQMVGDRRSPGATILGSGPTTSSANHRFLVPPTGPELRDGSWTVYEMAGPVHSDGCNSLVLALCSLYASGCGFCHYQY